MVSTGMISESIAWGQLNPFGAIFQYFPLDGLAINVNDANWKGNPSVPAVIQTPALAGVITVNVGTGVISGSGGTLFTTELNVGDFIWFNDNVNPDSQVIVEITQIFSNSDATCDINVMTLPDGNNIPYIYTAVGYFKVLPNETLDFDIFLDARADTTPTGASQAVAGNRFYYGGFQAYNWNTGVVEDIAQTYATSVGGNLKDLGWEDASSWETAIGTLLNYAGWNATITTVIPDTTTIDNSNQEIVVYYREIPTNFLGISVQVIDDMIFYEQSNVIQDYKAQLGVEPFSKQEVLFNAGDAFGYWHGNGNLGAFPNPFAAPYNAYPFSQSIPLNSNLNDGQAGRFGMDNVFIGEYQITYNQSSSFNLVNQDFQPNQFQVYFQYTVYDGLEAVAAEELTKQGIQVSPENVDWYRKNIERLAEVEAIDWEFDEENPPERDEPQEYNPEEDNDPRDYVPRNAKEVNNDGN
tara:strand:+ start:466 stop:1866 length:1401 start_codon:yes stop_codon:yes gene_type:complete